MKALHYTDILSRLSSWRAIIYSLNVVTVTYIFSDHNENIMIILKSGKLLKLGEQF